MRVVEGVHRHAPNGGTLSAPAALAGLADILVFVLDVADLADRRVADDGDPTDLARRHPDLRVVALTGKQLGRHTGRSHHLAAASRLELDVVHGRAERDIGERERVARLDIGLRPADHAIAHVEADRCQDVTLLAVGVGQQRDPGAPVRVVLDGADGRRNIRLVALEVDEAIELAVPASLVAHGDLSLRVASGVGLERHQQPLLRLLAARQVVEGADRHEAAAGRGGPVLLDRHD